MTRTLHPRPARLVRALLGASMLLGLAVAPAAAGASSRQTTPRLQPDAAPAAWSAPRRIDAAPGCEQVAAALDGAGKLHVAAACGGRIRYSTNQSGAWKTVLFARIAGLDDSMPQVVVTSTSVYVAWTRVSASGGCGGAETDTGVFTRHRSLTGAAWSNAIRVGSAGDSLFAFRRAGATAYLAVEGADGHAWFETVTGSTVKRTRVVGATGAVALQVGSDGTPRVAYQSATGVRLGVFGSTFTSARIGGTKAGDYAPILALDGANKSHVLFTRSPYGVGGCAIPPGHPDDGTYYATNRTGPWTSARISTHVMASALALNPASGRLHALVASMSILHYETALPGGAWSDVALVRKSVSSPVILCRASTGVVSVLYLHAAGGTTGVYLVTKG